ncbi:ABC transporter permease [Aliirhizobium smilacinae]|uniref:ABC transporter permease n=1 Tax=Aliirhizobium smilacinae TaxID=1395944 RepID=A0A5C4XHP4_9HYPH|nr:ABC transporter permease [Rhizobium smilacinae]TNM63055.1 ABC transporter permease [Rhizobium smilacinae]
MSERKDLGRAAQSAYLVVVLFLLIFPLLVLIPMSLGSSTTIAAIPQQWSLRWYDEVLGSPEWRSAFGWSMLTATAASIISTSMGYLGAAAMVRSKSRLQPLLQILILSPMMVPAVVVALATYLLSTSLGLDGGWVAISIGQSLLGLPVAALVIAASLRGIDETLLRAAVSLGARDRQVFLTVVLPMALHGILSAFGLSFLIAFDEVLIAIFLTTPSLQTLPVRIYQAVTYELTPAVAVVSVLLMAIVCAGMIIGGLYNWAMKRMVPATSQS